MNILLIATFSGISGASFSLISMAEELQRNGDNVTVFIPYDGELNKLLEEKNIPYFVSRSFVWVKPVNQTWNIKEKILYQIKKIKNLHSEFIIYKFIKKNEIDIVHINALTAPWGAKASLLTHAKLVWHIREMLPIGINKEFINKEKSLSLINKSNRIIAISSAVREFYKNELTNVNLVYNAIPTNIKLEREEIFSEKTVKITFMGRIVPGKGLEDILKACRILSEKNINYILEIYGSGPQDYILSLKKQVNSMQLEDNVLFKGFTSEVHSIWNKTDIALVCTKAEAFGRVTVEAMLNQVLVIGANTGGTVEIVGNDRGFLYQEGQYEELAFYIIKAMDNIDRSRLMAKRGREFVVENFNTDVFRENIINEYKTI